MKRHLLLLAGLAICLTSFGQDFKTVGYLPYYRFLLTDQIAYEKLTHLCLAFANPDMAGNLSVGGQDIDPIVSAAHAEGVEVLLSLAGGALTSEWAAAWKHLTKPENRSSFIHKIVDYVIAHDLEGIDVDLEWNYVDENYSGFVLELRDSLDVYFKLMTAALPGTTRYSEITDEAMLSFDFINMMVYDLTGPWAPNNPGPHSPYSFAVTSINYWLNQGMPADRLTLGVPFYGRDFTGSNTGNAFTYGSLVEIDPAFADLDQVDQAYYNGRPTIRSKTELAMEKVSGIMIWELGQDAFNEYSLLTAIYETINGVSGTSIATPEIDLAVAPNPFAYFLQVENTGAHQVHLQLYDMNGQLKMDRHLAGYSSIQLDSGHWPPGFYFLKVISGNGMITKKLVKS